MRGALERPLSAADERLADAMREAATGRDALDAILDVSQDAARHRRANVITHGRFALAMKEHETMTTLAEYAAQTEWIETTMPMIISFAVQPDASDEWLRQQIRGEAAPAPRLQQVIVQGSKEADRLVTALANLKHRRGLAYGGSSRQRYQRAPERA